MLTPYFVCTREVIQKSLNQNSSKCWDFVPSVLTLIKHISLFDVSLQHLKKRNFIFSKKIQTSLAYSTTMEKALDNIIFGRKFFICQPIFKIWWHFFRFLEYKKVVRLHFACGFSGQDDIKKKKKAVSK